MIVALVLNDLLLFGAGLACAYLHLTGRREGTDRKSLLTPDS